MAEPRFAIPASPLLGGVPAAGEPHGSNKPRQDAPGRSMQDGRTMDEHRSASRAELIARVTDLIETERRRQQLPRGTPAYEAAEAEEELKRRELWELLQREPPVRGDRHQ